jgi:hypothetical protein
LSPREFLAALARKAGRWTHERAAKDIMHTHPITAANDGVIIFSMIGTAVLIPYLVAVKSLHAHLKRGRIVLLNDGTLTADDRAVLAYHCDNPEILEKSDIDTGLCPRDNCWERLIAILNRRCDDYVIQLDSDTVTTGPVSEIIAAIEANRSFTLAGGVHEATIGFRSAKDTSTIYHANGPNKDHVQPKAEFAMASMPNADALRYIRGCAGFSGFAKSDAGTALVSQFSTYMENELGEDWQEWGSEQVASNFVIANDPDPLQLPYDQYVNHWLEPLPPTPAFVHFIGTHRFRRGNYTRYTQQAISILSH